MAMSAHAARRGALGYVLKEAADEELVEAVRRAAARERELLSMATVHATGCGVAANRRGLLRCCVSSSSGESCCCMRMSHDHPRARIPLMHKCLICAVAIAAIALTSGADATTPAAHWCRQGDPPLYASADTICGLAGNVITDYVNVCHELRNCQIRVDSPTSRTRYLITCNRRGSRSAGTVYCQGPVDTGIWTRFSALI